MRLHVLTCYLDCSTLGPHPYLCPPGFSLGRVLFVNTVPVLGHTAAAPPLVYLPRTGRSIKPAGTSAATQRWTFAGQFGKGPLPSAAPSHFTALPLQFYARPMHCTLPKHRRAAASALHAFFACRLLPIASHPPAIRFATLVPLPFYPIPRQALLPRTTRGTGVL